MKTFKKMKTGNKEYLLRLPRDLKIAAQHRALDDGISLRELIIKALEKLLLTETKGDGGNENKS